MREIKFRVWDGKSMSSPINLRPTDIKIEKDGEYSPIVWKENHQDLVLMQYTGLKDKTGKEIYEGDIMDNNETVEWRSVRGGWDTVSSTMSTELHGPRASEMEVIGNIYDR